MCDYGAAAEGKDAELLQGAKNAALKSIGAHLVSEKKIRLGAYPGLKFEAKSDMEHSTVRMYMTGTTLYQALMAAPLDRRYDEAARFLDSFELMAKAGN